MGTRGSLALHGGTLSESLHTERGEKSKKLTSEMSPCFGINFRGSGLFSNSCEYIIAVYFVSFSATIVKMRSTCYFEEQVVPANGIHYLNCLN